MATMNPFDLLGDDDNDDPSQLIAKLPAPKAQPKPAKLPSKPLPPAQAVREVKNEAARGGGRGGGHGYGRGRGGPGGGGPGGTGGGYRRDSANDEHSSGSSALFAGQGSPEDVDAKNSFNRGYGAPRGPYRGGRHGGFSNGERGVELPRRVFERRSGTGRGNEFKREGSGRGNWGTQTDEISQVNEEAINESEQQLGDEKPAGEEDAAKGNKENPTDEPEEKEHEEKEMTLEEYQKVLEEKRKALQALKTEERKVDTKEFESMWQLSNKKENGDVFLKLGYDKDKRKEAADKEEKAKKSVSINEFLKPAEGERHYNAGGHGRGSRRGYGGSSRTINVAAPSIEDPGQFPTLGAK